LHPIQSVYSGTIETASKGATENAGLENRGPSKMQGWKTRDQYLWNAKVTSKVKQKWTLLSMVENVQSLVIYTPPCRENAF